MIRWVDLHAEAWNVSKRAQELASRFEQASDAFVSVVARLDEEQWRVFCPSEGRTVAALARHVAGGYRHQTTAFRSLAEGRPVHTWTWALLDQSNAEDGKTFANCDQGETVRLLQEGARDAVDMIRALSDEQLERTGVYIEELPPMTVDRMIERIMVGHPRSHLESILVAVGHTV